MTKDFSLKHTNTKFLYTSEVSIHFNVKRYLDSYGYAIIIFLITNHEEQLLCIF